MNTYSFFEKKSIINEKTEELGYIVGGIFDIIDERIIGFIYKKNFISYNYFTFEDIKEIKETFIILKSKKKNKIKNIYEIIGKSVKDESLKTLGTIQDIEFDLNFKLKSIIIDEGFNIGSIEIVNKKRISVKKNIRKISKKYIVSYQKDYVIVKDKLLIDNNKKTLENFYKIFINISNPTYNLKK